MNDFYVQRIGANLWYALTALALLEAVGIYIWRFRREPGAAPLVAFQICKAAWLLGLLVAGSSLRASTQIIWMDVIALAAIAISCVGFRFISELSGLGSGIRRWIDGANLAILATYAVAMLTDPRHHAYWHISFHRQMAQLNDGPLRALGLLATRGLNLLYLILLAVWAARERGMRKRQLEPFLLAALISWAGVLLSLRSATYIPAPIPISLSPPVW